MIFSKREKNTTILGFLENPLIYTPFFFLECSIFNHNFSWNFFEYKNPMFFLSKILLNIFKNITLFF
jgi:hypothetical protein